MTDNFKPTGGQIAKFVILSLLGVFLFLGPIPTGEGAFNIPMGIIIDWTNANIFGAFTWEGPGGDAGTLRIHHLIALIAITLSLLMTLLAYTVKPGFIENNPKVRELFRCSPIYIITKILAALFIWAIWTGIGPDWLIRDWTGADIMVNLVAALVTIFIFLIPLM